MCDSLVLVCFFLMLRRPPRSTRTDTLFPYTTLFRSVVGGPFDGQRAAVQHDIRLAAGEAAAMGGHQRGTGAGATGLGDAGATFPDPHADGLRIEDLGEFDVDALREQRSEERSVGEECVSTGRSRGVP